MKDINNSQTGGDSSLNLQATNITINAGMSYEDVKSVAISVFRDNFEKLSQVAVETAVARATEVTDAFFEEVKMRHAQPAAYASSPDFQLALLDAQKSYARRGDRELRDALVQILVARSEAQDDTLIQVTLNEAISVAGKLVSGQHSVLGILFLMRHLKRIHFFNRDDFYVWMETLLSPFLANATLSDPSFRHLQYAGCISLTPLTPFSLSKAFRDEYAGLWFRGLTHADYDELLGPQFEPYRRSCLSAPELFQPAFLDKKQFCDSLPAKEMERPQQDRIWNKLIENVISGSEIEAELRKRPLFATLLDQWDSSSLRIAHLTSVGIAIGHAAYKRATGVEAPLGLWLF